ncbi:MAG: hypothetical protein PHF86_13990 [Candidatus Nanoarchaeia archaeon]|nr:hypothetical protein [Candidatus Nanoarchaeia archaeon]
MGIQVEFNPDLALRNIIHYTEKRRSLEECIPENLKEGEIYNFLKKGQRNYWLYGELPLLQTEGESKLSRPLASIIILEVTHFLKDEEVYTKGKYKVIKILNQENYVPYFDGINKIKI